jgi:EAL domain-containing protein (putative c-di-GMP-specific phosphodiesterase class I)
MLQETARRLRKILRAGDTVARIHNDEFGILLTGVANAEDAAIAARKVLAAFESPAELDTVELFITLRVGIALYPEDGVEADTLMKNANAALSELRGAGAEQFNISTPQLQTRAQRRLVLERELRHAVERREFVLHYQPVVDLNKGYLLGVEALLRWHSGQLGEVAPVQFIPVAEESGLIIPIGEWVLREVGTQARRWQARGLRPLQITVNLSVVQLRHGSLLDHLDTALQQMAAGPANWSIELEVTETKLMETAERTGKVLASLHPRGIRLSIDDFGTGYSSLSYLKRLPVDTLKIDTALIHHLPHDADAAAVVKAIIALAHHLDLHVVAKGIETEQQLRIIRDLGCDAAQGYLFSKPVPAGDIASLYGRQWFEERQRMSKG